MKIDFERINDAAKNRVAALGQLQTELTPFQQHVDALEAALRYFNGLHEMVTVLDLEAKNLIDPVPYRLRQITELTSRIQNQLFALAYQGSNEMSLRALAEFVKDPK